MFTLRVLFTGAAALVSYFLMFVFIMRFFDSMSVASGVVMVASWLATIGLCYLADRVSKADGLCQT